jgi:hypothetical protein
MWALSLYFLLLNFPGPDNTIGHPAISRTFVDTEKHATFVSLSEFAADGVVTGIEVNVDLTNEGSGHLKIGIYRPRASSCAFKLIREFIWECSSMSNGHNEVGSLGLSPFFSCKLSRLILVMACKVKVKGKVT